METELDKWMSHFDELTALAEMLMRDDAESVSNLELQLKLLHAEWDQIVQVMEEKSKEVRRRDNAQANTYLHFIKLLNPKYWISAAIL